MTGYERGIDWWLTLYFFPEEIKSSQNKRSQKKRKILLQNEITSANERANDVHNYFLANQRKAEIKIFDEPRVKLVRTDVIGTVLGAMTRELY